MRGGFCLSPPPAGSEGGGAFLAPGPVCISCHLKTPPTTCCCPPLAPLLLTCLRGQLPAHQHQQCPVPRLGRDDASGTLPLRSPSSVPLGSALSQGWSSSVTHLSAIAMHPPSSRYMVSLSTSLAAGPDLPHHLPLQRCPVTPFPHPAGPLPRCLPCSLKHHHHLLLCQHLDSSTQLSGPHLTKDTDWSD